MARVLLFGALADLAGWRERLVDAETLSALRAAINDDDPVLGERLDGPGVFAIVNQILTRGDAPLSPDDEVAFAPPVSGG